MKKFIVPAVLMSCFFIANTNANVAVHEESVTDNAQPLKDSPWDPRGGQLELRSTPIQNSDDTGR